MNKQDVLDALTWSKIYDEYGFEHLTVHDRYAISYAFSKVREKLGFGSKFTIGGQITKDHIEERSQNLNKESQNEI